MSELNRECIVCGTRYKYCYSCPSDLHNPSWRMLFDTENCRDIFNTLCKDTQNLISKEEVVKELNTYDLTKMNSFKAKVKSHICRILEENVLQIAEEQEQLSSEKVETKVETKTETKSETKMKPKTRVSKKKNSECKLDVLKENDKQTSLQI